MWRHQPCGERDAGLNRGLTVPKVPLKDFSSFLGFTLSFNKPQMLCFSTGQQSSIRSAVSDQYPSPSGTSTTELQFWNWKYGFAIIMERVLNGFPQQQHTEVSPTASRMWKWVNRLPSRPSYYFHWSSSSWLITERNNVSSEKALPRQRSGSGEINACT